MPSLPDLSVVIVNWNTCAFLQDCLASLVEASRSISMEVIVVDNASSDGSLEMMLAEFPQVRLIRNERNAGYALANNQGLSVANGRYCLLLNADTLVTPYALRQMVTFMDAYPQAGACGPQLRYPDGKLQPSGRNFPTLKSTLGELLPVPDSWRNKWRGPLSNRDYQQVVRVDEVSGAALCLSRKALSETGFLDESFFFLGEDIDLCWRLQKAGWKTYYLPNAHVVHHWGGSHKNSTAMHISLLAQRGYYLLFQKHKTRREALLLKWILFLLTGIKLAKWLVLSVFRPGQPSARHVLQRMTAEYRWLWRH